MRPLLRDGQARRRGARDLHAVSGAYPTDGLVNLLLSDTVWLPPFAVILSRLYGVRRPMI